MVYCSTTLLQCVDHVAIGIWEKIKLQDALSGRLKLDRHGTVSCMDQIGRGRKISPPMKSRRDSCHRHQDSHSGWMDNVVGLRILAAGELEVTQVTHRGCPFCFAAGAIGSPVNRRFSALCRVALPFHRVAVTPYRCLINAGEVATTVDTNSRSR
jgi:hypothetical protein